MKAVSPPKRSFYMNPASRLWRHAVPRVSLNPDYCLREVLLLLSVTVCVHVDDLMNVSSSSASTTKQKAGH